MKKTSALKFITSVPISRIVASVQPSFVYVTYGIDFSVLTPSMCLISNPSSRFQLHRSWHRPFVDAIHPEMKKTSALKFITSVPISRIVVGVQPSFVYVTYVIDFRAHVKEGAQYTMDHYRHMSPRAYVFLWVKEHYKFTRCDI